MNRDRIAQRAARQAASRPDQTQVTRRGAVDINNVDQATFREDLGFNMTGAQYEQYKGEEEKFNTEYGGVLQKNNEALAQIGALDKQLTAYQQQAQAARTNTEAEWKKAEKGFVDVYMVGRNHLDPSVKDNFKKLSDIKNIKPTDFKPTILHKVRLPRDVVESLNKESFNKGDGSFTGNWHNGAYYVSDTPRGISDSYGKELRQSLDDTYTKVKLKYYESVSPELKKVNAQISTALKTLGTQKGQLKEFQAQAAGNLEAAGQQKTIRDTAKNRWKTAYETSKKERQALFSGK